MRLVAFGLQTSLVLGYTTKTLTSLARIFIAKTTGLNFLVRSLMHSTVELTRTSTSIPRESLGNTCARLIECHPVGESLFLLCFVPSPWELHFLFDSVKKQNGCRIQ